MGKLLQILYYRIEVLLYPPCVPFVAQMWKNLYSSCYWFVWSSYQAIEVLWKPPSLHWVKVNIDGVGCGSLGLAGIGGIFRDHFGSCVGCFATSLRVATSVEAVLHVVIHVVNLAWEKSWHSLWIKCDTSLLVLFTSASHNHVP